MKPSKSPRPCPSNTQQALVSLLNNAKRVHGGYVGATRRLQKKASYMLPQQKIHRMQIEVLSTRADLLRFSLGNEKVVNCTDFIHHPGWGGSSDPKLLCVACHIRDQRLTKRELSNCGCCRGHTFCVPKCVESDQRSNMRRIHSITETDNFQMKPDFSDNPLYELDLMENNNNRTLKELATPDYLQLDPAQTYKLKFGLIHLLPKFHGYAGEDPHKHLKEFHVVCSMMRPQGKVEAEAERRPKSTWLVETRSKQKPSLFRTIKSGTLF
ncbi:hypothetical protein CR513_26127, partial [Mucuna pruriens]